jgi:hypothetical protein
MDMHTRGAGPGLRGGRAGTSIGRLARAAALASALASAQAHAAPPAPARDDLGGTYRMEGTSRVDAVAPLGGDLEARGDAIVRTGPAGAVRLRLAAEGQACELSAKRAEDGALSFDAGQRCAFDLREEDARGHVEARLRSGRGRLRDRRLTLDLAFDLSGAVAVKTAAKVQVFGMEIPSAWTPEIPLDGAATVQVEGDRDESRAAQK